MQRGRNLVVKRSGLRGHRRRSGKCDHYTVKRAAVRPRLCLDLYERFTRMPARGSRRCPPAPVPRPQWRARSRCGRRSPETPIRRAPRLSQRARAPAGSTDRRSSVSRVMSHRAEPISTPIARTRAPDATKEARRGSSGTWPRAVSRMSNRLSPSNEQPGEPGWTAARKAPSAGPVSPRDDAEGAQPWEMRVAD